MINSGVIADTCSEAFQVALYRLIRPFILKYP